MSAWKIIHCATLLLVALVTTAQGAVVVAAEDTPRENPVTAGRDAFAKSARIPWYDAKQDALRPINLRSLSEFDGKFSGTLLKWIVWGVVAVLLAAIVMFLLMALRNRSRRGPGGQKRRGDEILAADQVEALPFLAGRSRRDLLGEARRYYEQGDYSEAIIYLFSYQLVQLDKFAMIQLAKGKTNRQYLREIARARNLRGLLESTMLKFEFVFFGGQPLDREGFEMCWHRLDEFESLLSHSAS